MVPVSVRNVSKLYKRYSQKHKFLTIKSALVNRTIFRDLRSDETFEALRDVSFQVNRGETVSIIGENGSGKSTMLKLLAGISKPTSGEILTEGRISALIELGAGFHPEISGRENIFINGIIMGLTKKTIQDRYDQIVKFAELEDFIDNPVKSYSSGMYMRLGFSIAINVNPDILLIDEVLAVGDASFVPKCLDKIFEFKRRGKTIVFVSHDLDTVGRISDRVIWLQHGRIEMEGYPKKVTDAYMQYIHAKEEDQEPGTPSAGEPDNSENRWGNREIEITALRLKNSRGQPATVFRPDEPVTIEMETFAHQPQSDFIFGVGVYTYEGQLCYGSNTHIEDYSSIRISGTGTARMIIPALNLINGTYFLDVAVHQKDGTPFDYHHFMHQFKVRSGYKEIGVTRIPHRWEFSDNIEIKPPGSR